MGSLITRHPFWNDFFNDVNQGFFVRPLHGDPLPAPNQIKIDVQENERQYTVTAEIPGVNKDDIQIGIHDNLVTLRAEICQRDQQEKSDKSLRVERYYGEVSRSFQLPSEIDVAESKAKYENGVLTLALFKKRNSAQPRTLKVE